MSTGFYCVNLSLNKTPNLAHCHSNSGLHGFAKINWLDSAGSLVFKCTETRTVILRDTVLRVSVS